MIPFNAQSKEKEDYVVEPANSNVSPSTSGWKIEEIMEEEGRTELHHQTVDPDFAQDYREFKFDVYDKLDAIFNLLESLARNSG